MHWSLIFVVRVICSLTLLLAALIYTLVGITQQQCLENDPYTCGVKTLLVCVLLLCAVFFLGFFEAGQIALCRLAVSVHQQPATCGLHPSHLIHKLLSKPKGIEKYLVSIKQK